MVKRQLLYKEWKQSELTFILVILVAVFATPLSLFMGYSTFQDCLKSPSCISNTSTFTYMFNKDTFLSLSWVMGIFFAVMQLGFERNKGQIDFTLSLPFSRSSIFHSKFFLGVGIIASVHVVSYLIIYLLKLGLHPIETPEFNGRYFYALLSALMVYSLFLAAGTLTGSAISQTIVGFSTSILPFLMIGLPIVHLDFIIKPTEKWIDTSINYLISPISPITYIANSSFRQEYYHWFNGEEFIIPLVMMFIFYLVGLFSFAKHPTERNGRFFLFPAMDRPIQIMVIVFGVLGFGWAGFSSDSLLGYFVGMIIGGVVGALTSYFLIYRKR